MSTRREAVSAGDTLPAELRAWRDRGTFVAVGPHAHRVYVQSVGAADAPSSDTLLVLHGFPESSYSFAKNVDALASRFRRVVLLDLPGYGLSDKPADASYSLFEQADAALEAWHAVGVAGGHLLAHDMGDSVTTELLARATRGLLPAWLSGGFPSVTLTNGSVVMRLARLRVTQRLLRTPLGPWLGRASRFRMFAQQVRSASGGPIDDVDIALMWAAFRHGGGPRVQHLLARYIDERLRFEEARWLPALAATRVPVHVCWGALDRVAPVVIAHHLKDVVCPGAKLTVLPRAGHFCQQEDPAAWNDAVLAFWAR
jgi:pimeloyl-ACP methyl ester carboxylesterase